MDELSALFKEADEKLALVAEEMLKERPFESTPFKSNTLRKNHEKNPCMYNIGGLSLSPELFRRSLFAA